MPGNEVGDRIHNFFDQDNLSQGQHHSQVVDETWSGLNNNPWAGSQGHAGTPHISNLKNNTGQQSAGSSVQHSLEFPHSTPGPEFVRSQSQGQQPPLNGHGHQVFQTRQNEANLLGVDTDSDRSIMSSSGFLTVDSQLGTGPESQKKNLVRMDFNESPVNYDFFGGQQQISSHQASILQAFPRQQSGIIDMQLLQQQFMLKQMQEMQRQQQLQKQQLQQQEARKPNSMNQVSAFAKQAAANHSQALINGIPIHETSNYSWQPDLMAANTNWPQQGVPPVMQGSFRGHMFSPEHGQSMPRLMSMVPQQVNQSLYGLPISGTRCTPSQHSPVQMDKPSTQQMPGSGNSIPSSQYTGFLEQVSVQDGTLISRQGYRGENLIMSSDGKVINGGFNLGNLQKENPQQSNGPMQGICPRQELPGLSETSQEETNIKVAPQHVATLDPTEAKILFGSDDNLWDAFGKGASMGSGGYNMLDGTNFLSALPSVQSGSWSALMQSAVAETSSGDTGLREECSGLAFRNTEPAVGSQQIPNVSGNSKQQSDWIDNSSQSASSLNSRPYPLSHETNTGVSYNSIPVQQSGADFSHEQSERLHTGSPSRHMQQFPGHGTKWLDRSLLQKAAAESSHFYGKAPHSSDAESNAKSIPGSWANQQRVPSYSSGSQPLSGWNLMDSVSPGKTAALSNQGNENSFQDSRNVDKKGPMFESMGHGAGIWKNDSIAELENAKFAIGSHQVNREDTNQSALLDSSSGRTNHQSSQQIPKNNNIDFWKHSGSSVNHKGVETPGKSQTYMVKNDHNFELSRNSSLANGANGAVETHEMQNSNIKERTANSFPNIAHHTSNIGTRENAWLGGNDSGTLPGGKQKASIHIGRKPSGMRKFQYHPMGDLDADMEPSYGTKHVTHSQSILQQVSQGLKGFNQGCSGHSNFPSHVARNSVEIEKGHSSGIRGETKGFDEIPSKSIPPGSACTSSAPFDLSVHSPNKSTSSCQNMLELLHKVDQSTELGIEMHFSSVNHNQPSEMPEADTSDAPVHLQKNRSPASHGFGLQLGPPSQRVLIPENAFPSQSHSQMINSLSSKQVFSNAGEKGHTWLVPTSSVQSLPPSEISHGHLRNTVSGTSLHAGNNGQGKLSTAFSAGFPHPRSHIPNQLMTDTGERHSESVYESSNRFSSQPKQTDESFERGQTLALPFAPDMSRHMLQNDPASSAVESLPTGDKQNHARDSSQQFRVLEGAPAPQHYASTQDGVSSKLSPTMWTSVPTQLRPCGSQPFQDASNMFKPNLQLHNSSGPIFSQPEKLEDQIMQTGVGGQVESGACSMNSQGLVGRKQPAKGDHLQQVSFENDQAQKTMSASHEKESVVNHLTETALSNLTSTQKQIEAFGRSLKPNNVLHQNYSLLHQIQGMQNVKVDHGNRSLKRCRSPDGSVDAQLIANQAGLQFDGHNNVVNDAPPNHISIAPEDSKMLSISAKTADNQDTSAPSKDMLAFGRNDSQNFAGGNIAVSVRGDHSQISPQDQMAPSWFDQYGTFKNGHILPMHDARKAVSMTTSELPFTAGRPDRSHAHYSIEQGNAAAASPFAIVQKSSIPSSAASENISTLQSLLPDPADASLVVKRPNKRKSAISEHVPWHKEVMQGPQGPQNMSTAELDWALAANRLTEKVEDEVEMVDDGLPVLRSKRRLMLTTQLMQILLRSPLASILSADAILHYESAAYFVARSTIGDACSTLSRAGSDTPAPSNSGQVLPEKIKSSEKISDQYFSKVMEDLISRTRKLENNLLSLDKRALVSDLRVECQDLERFSVINRFAKFHGRGQADGAVSSSSSDASASAQKSCLQRYVTALPMPRNLPDRVQCLSL